MWPGAVTLMKERLLAFPFMPWRESLRTYAVLSRILVSNDCGFDDRRHKAGGFRNPFNRIQSYHWLPALACSRTLFVWDRAMSSGKIDRAVAPEAEGPTRSRQQSRLITVPISHIPPRRWARRYWKPRMDRGGGVRFHRHAHDLLGPLSFDLGQLRVFLAPLLPSAVRLVPRTLPLGSTTPFWKCWRLFECPKLGRVAALRLS